MSRPKVEQTPSAVALTLAQRAQLVQLAPTEHGDHLVSMSRPGQADVFGIVRCDSVGRRLVAVALTADDAHAKARPIADRSAPVQHAGSSRTEAGAGAPNALAQKRAAEASLDAERADYRRACAAAGITAPKLL